MKEGEGAVGFILSRSRTLQRGGQGTKYGGVGGRQPSLQGKGYFGRY